MHYFQDLCKSHPGSAPHWKDRFHLLTLWGSFRTTLIITSFSSVSFHGLALGLVSECPGQIPAESFTAREHGSRQDGWLSAPSRHAVGPRIGDFQHVHEPVLHPHHLNGLNEPQYAVGHLSFDFRPRQLRRPRISESFTDDADESFLMTLVSFLFFFFKEKRNYS